MSAGLDHTCALTPGGSAYCWGDNQDGQLGDDSNTERDTPSPVVGGYAFSTISAGGKHTCGVTTAGELYCWGLNSHGQLGNNSTHNSSLPTPVSSPSS